MISERERWLFIVFFVTHVPITVFIDAQAALPRKFFPPAALNLVDWYTSSEGFADPLMGEKPTWFRHIVTCELVFQLPFFFLD